MIGANQSLTPTQPQFRKSPVSEMSGISPLRKLTDSVTESAAGNAYAGGIRQGATAAADYRNQTAGRGRSLGKQDEMFAQQQQAAGTQEGAMQAAAMRAEDQSFNANQNFAQNQMVQDRLTNNKENATARQQSNWQRRFGIGETKAQNAMKRRAGLQSMWLSLLGNLG